MIAGHAPRRVLAVTGLAAEARVAAGAGVEAIALGSDTRGLATRIERRLGEHIVGIVSFGIAGALDESLRPGTCVVGRTVLTPTGPIACSSEWTAALLRALPEAVHGDIAGADAIAADPRAKRALRGEALAHVVDTESHVVAQLAQARALPFAVLRAVSDPVERSLPPAALIALRQDGRVRLLAVLRSILQAPGQVPALVRTARDAAAALAALSEGRRRLGPGLGHPDLGELLIDVT